MFIGSCKICSFADDNTLYSCGMQLSSILDNLKYMKIIWKWFKINVLEANSGKLRFMVIGKKPRNKIKLKINSITINDSDKVELLEITTDSKLALLMKSLCSHANYKLYALRKKKKILDSGRDKASALKLLHNTFMNSQFNYAPIY